MTVNLVSLTVLAEKTTENTHASHPDNLLGHTSVGLTLTLTEAHVATLSLSNVATADTSTGNSVVGLTNNETGVDLLADGLAWSVTK